VSLKEFNALYSAARRQQAIMALTSGHFEWRNYRGIAHKAYSMVFGKHRERPARDARVPSVEQNVEHGAIDALAVKSVERV
jgi:hypothetical protein